MIEARPTGDTLVARAAVAFADFRDGDRAAFDDLMKMVTPLLWHTVRGQGVDRVAAEDVLQTVWLSLLRHADSVRDPRTVVKWLLTSTRREAWRVRQRERSGHLAREPLPGKMIVRIGPAFLFQIAPVLWRKQKDSVQGLGQGRSVRRRRHEPGIEPS